MRRVAVIDDDVSVRESLPDLLGELGFAAETFASAEEFLASNYTSKADCLILDIGLPGMSGFDLERELIRRGHAIPIVFITGRSEQSLPPGQRLKDGLNCVFKPFSDQALRQALDVALRRT